MWKYGKLFVSLQPKLHINYVFIMVLVAFKNRKRDEIIAAFGEFWRCLSHLGKFNTCQWHLACTKFGHSNIFATLSLSLRY